MKTSPFILIIIAFIFSLIGLFSNLTPSIISATPSEWIELCTNNCGFEAGNMSGWTEMSGSFSVNGDFVHSGSYSVSGTSDVEAYFYRNFSLSAYREWIDSGYGTAEFGAWLEPGDSEQGRVLVGFFDQNGQDLGVGYDSDWVQTSGENYQFFGGTHFIPAGADYARLEVRMRRTSGSNTDCNVDDITFKVEFIVPTATPTLTPTLTATPSPTPTVTPTPLPSSSSLTYLPTLFTAPPEALNVAGIWSGVLTQPGTIFTFELALIQANNQIQGTSRIDDFEGYYAIMDLNGLVVGDEIYLDETEIIETNGGVPGWQWCLKTMTLNYSQTAGVEKLTGTWEDPGCNSGTITLEKQ